MTILGARGDPTSLVLYILRKDYTNTVMSPPTPVASRWSSTRFSGEGRDCCVDVEASYGDDDRGDMAEDWDTACYECNGGAPEEDGFDEFDAGAAYHNELLPTASNCGR